MPIRELRVKGYRSIRDIRLRLSDVNVLVGPNGCGKSNLYQSMYLLSAAAHGQLAGTLAEEGGLASTLWAGPRRKSSSSEPLRLSLAVSLNDKCYELTCGLPIPPGNVTRGEPSQFVNDPEVKTESLDLATGQKKRPWVQVMGRDHGTAWIRDADGNRAHYPFDLSNSESVMTQLREPHRFPHLAAISHEMRGWRFYHHFRTDALAPARHPQVGVRTPILDKDGNALAAALQTIREVGDREGLEQAIDAAFPGARVVITSPEARFQLAMKMPGLLRPLEARELSDGTLRYLCLLAALLSPRPPALLAFNEPENSLHPDLIVPLARLIASASVHSQIWITTHSQALAQALEDMTGESPIQLHKVDGETQVANRGILD